MSDIIRSEEFIEEIHRENSIPQRDQMNILDTNAEVMNTNETFLSKDNTNINKILSLQKQIVCELGGRDINFKIKGDKSIFSGESVDIPAKIVTLYKELNDMEDRSRGTFSNKSKKDDTDVIVTKNISEFKLSLMIKNRIGDEVKQAPDFQVLQQNHNTLLRKIRNPNNNISEKTKSSMDRLLNNGFVESTTPQLQVTSPSKISRTEKISVVKMNSPMKTFQKEGYTKGATLNMSNFAEPLHKGKTTVIETKKSEIMNILNNRASIKESNKISNNGGGSSKRINEVLKNKDSDDFIRKIVTSGENEGVMKKLKSMIPDITTNTKDYDRSRTGINTINTSSIKVKRLDDQFNKMFK